MRTNEEKLKSEMAMGRVCDKRGCRELATTYLSDKYYVCDKHKDETEESLTQF